MTLIQQTISSTSSITTLDTSRFIADAADDDEDSQNDVKSDVTKLNDNEMSNIDDHSLSACDEPKNAEGDLKA
jgi:hypothetical protein